MHDASNELLCLLYDFLASDVPLAINYSEYSISMRFSKLLFLIYEHQQN